MYIAPKVEFPSDKSVGFVVPYWCVGTAAPGDAVNMVAGVLKVDLAYKDTLVSVGGSRTSSAHVSLPVLYNSAPLKVGAALLKSSSPVSPPGVAIAARPKKKLRS
eukprot:5474208-Pyramimonas_sp.AAC.1